MVVTREEFEDLVQAAFDALPDPFQHHLDNLRILVESEPSDETVRKMKLPHKSSLLGLYEGIPLTQRGTSYGMYPAVPDRITLYKKNIERRVATRSELQEAIRTVLIHEIAHYYGMDEDQVRAAGY